jgi:hypothetical protein
MLAVVGGLSMAERANAQTAPYGQSGFVPNFYNRQTQPLSPYLNLLRGGSPAVNYFYGVRPGLQSGGYLGPYAPQPGAALGPRQTFFPIFDTLAEPPAPGDLPSGMGPTGHPVAFRNTLNYYGGGSAGQQQGMPATGANPAAAAPRRGFLQQPTRR